MTGSREAILSGVRQALAHSPSPARADTTGSAPDLYPKQVDLLEEFTRRFQAIGGQYHRVSSPDDLARVLTEIMALHQQTEISVAPTARSTVPDLDRLLTGLGLAIRPPEPESAEKVLVGLTGVTLAMAYSGSLVLDSSETGNLSASLLPSVHIALVPAQRIVYGVDQALGRLGREDRPRGMVFVTGPSRTADIELTLVMGVHGPGSVHAVILDY